MSEGLILSNAAHTCKLATAQGRSHPAAFCSAVRTESGRASSGPERLRPSGHCQPHLGKFQQPHVGRVRPGVGGLDHNCRCPRDLGSFDRLKAVTTAVRAKFGNIRGLGNDWKPIRCTARTFAWPVFSISPKALHSKQNTVGVLLRRVPGMSSLKGKPSENTLSRSRLVASAAPRRPIT